MVDKTILFWAIVVVQRKYITKSVATYPLHTFLELVINKKRQKFRWLSVEIEEMFKFLKEKWWEIRKKMGACQITLIHGSFATCKFHIILSIIWNRCNNLPQPWPLTLQSVTAMWHLPKILPAWTICRC